MGKALLAIAIAAAVIGCGISSTDKPSAATPTTTPKKASAQPSKPTPDKIGEAIKTAKKLPDYYDWTAIRDVREVLMSVPPSDTRYKESQALAKKLLPRYQAEMREALAAMFAEVIAGKYPHLNYVEPKITKVRGGYAIWAYHVFFNEYELQAGEAAHVIEKWMNPPLGSRLKEAGVVRIGLKGQYGSCWFDL